jgi:hypothetical protein
MKNIANPVTMIIGHILLPQGIRWATIVSAGRRESALGSTRAMRGGTSAVI